MIHNISNIIFCNRTRNVIIFTENITIKITFLLLIPVKWKQSEKIQQFSESLTAFHDLLFYLLFIYLPKPGSRNDSLSMYQQHL